MTHNANITLPDLTKLEWQIAVTALGRKTDISTGEFEQFRSGWTGDEKPSLTKLLTAIAIDHGIDELPREDPRVRQTLQSFLLLTEAEAMTVLFVNNILWETGEALWLRTAATAA